MRSILFFLFAASEFVLGMDVSSKSFSKIGEDIPNQQFFAYADPKNSKSNAMIDTKETSAVQQPVAIIGFDSVKYIHSQEDSYFNPNHPQSDNQSPFFRKRNGHKTKETHPDTKFQAQLKRSPVGIDISSFVEKEILSLSKPLAYYFDGMNLNLTRYFPSKFATRDLMRKLTKGGNLERINRAAHESLTAFVSRFKPLDIEASLKCKKINAQPNMCFYFSFQEYAQEIEKIEFVSRELLWNALEETPNFELTAVMCEANMEYMFSRFRELQISTPLWIFENGFMKAQRSAEVAQENLTRWKEFCGYGAEVEF